MDPIVDSILSGTAKKSPKLYEVLGCTKDASGEQIVAEYRARVRNLHPDKTGFENEEFVKTKLAYETLSDPGTRKIYDLWLDSPLPITFNEFSANQEAIRQSMHWAMAPKTPMVEGIQENPSTAPPMTKWKDQDRYESESVRKFRDYAV
ncbi:unnamed protein product, partial [Mesorhabditis belari]|uniref:J domain-containing protein n=1 Tax=Mesorhabditis belari TaxID=2138241 RepID=A0AAF3EC27_9BILA